jgi:hypothetical protein
MSERLSPSYVDDLEETQKAIGQYGEPIILKLCDEIRACWADIVAATEAMQKQSDEMALLRAIALAVAEEEAQSPATESAAFAALRDWQKWKREG